MPIQEFTPGDHVFHPRFGLGVIAAVAPRFQDGTGESARYYHIQLASRGLLFVPVERADSLGMRRLVNSLAAIESCLRTRAGELPANARERVVELRGRWEATEPRILAETMRDLLGLGRTAKLNANDKQWLTRAGQRLSEEAAIVDAIAPADALKAITREVDALKAHWLAAPAR